MSDLKSTNDKPEVGDASHLVDDLKPTRVREPIIVPMTDHEIGKDGKPGDAELVGEMKGTLTQTKTVEQLSEDIKRSVEPCTKCRYFYFPKTESQEYKAIKAICSSVLNQLPSWMRSQFFGYGNPDEWGVCRKHNGMIHSIGNTCKFWKPRGILGVFGVHRAKDRRDA